MAGFLEVPGLAVLLRSIATYLGFRTSIKIVERTKKLNAKGGLYQRVTPISVLNHMDCHETRCGSAVKRALRKRHLNRRTSKARIVN